MDSVTASLLQEAGIAQPKSGAPDWSALNAQGRAAQPERDALARSVVNAEGGTDPAAQSNLTQEQWSARIGGQPAANDPITASLLREVQEAKSRTVPGEENAPEPSKSAPASTFEKYVKGPAEVVASLATGAAGTLAGNVAGIVKGFTGGKYGTAEGAREAAARAQEVARSLTYVPRSESGQEYLSGLGDVVSATKLQGLGPPEGMMLGALAASGPRAAARGATRAAAAASDVPGATPQGASVGAAGVNVAEQAKALAATASPELQAEVAKIGPKITQRGLKALERHVDADTLPVPVKLTEGQATRDVTRLTNERNNRAAMPEYADRFNEQNKALAENLPAIREKAAPDIYVNSQKELGEVLIQAYKDKDAALNAAISTKYKALRDANGGAFPLDGVAFVDAADAALHKALVYDFVPAGLRKTMDRLKGSSDTSAPLTKDQFYDKYYQHIDLRGRKSGTSDNTLNTIQNEGFKSAGVNLTPAYQGGQPLSIVERNYAPKKGDTVYLVPESATINTPNGRRIKDGWKPEPGEVFVAGKDFGSAYEGYLAARKVAGGRAGGTMTFEQFESMRTNLARIARSQADGNEKHAAAIVRDALESMPLTPEAAQLKPLADAARAAAKERFDLIKGDRAYKAIVKGQAGADAFIEKYVLGKGADSKQVATMRENLAHDPAAQQAMASGAIGKLESDTLRTGENFSQANYNKSLAKLSPKLDALFDQATRADLEKLGRVAETVQSYPAGHSVNTSNTFTAALGRQLGNVAEIGLNRLAGAGSNWFPIGSIMREKGAKMAAQREAQRSLKTGAGLRIKEVAEGKK